MCNIHALIKGQGNREKKTAAMNWPNQLIGNKNAFFSCSWGIYTITKNKIINIISDIMRRKNINTIE